MSVSDHEETSNSIPLFSRLVATGFFAGYIPWASGTFGTAVGVLLYLLPHTDGPFILPAMVVTGFFLGVFTSGKVAAVVGHKLTRTAELAKATFQSGRHGEADPSIVVIDEIVGMWVSLLFLPKTTLVVVIAFVLFRVFDILKPPPAGRLEGYPHGWGIMLDDVVAGVYANLATQILFRVVESAFGA
jgi:phosphatidylglycerophosphatase A